MSAEITWRNIEHAAELAALEPQWWALWRRCPAATPFQSPAWLLPWWDAFAPGELATLAGFDGTRLVALAPLYRETDPRGRRLLPLGISLSDFQDILVQGGDEEAICAALAGRLSDSAMAWDSLIFTELRADAQALRLRAPPKCESFAERSSACPVLMLPETIDALPAALPKRTRRSLQGARNRAARRGPVEILAATETSVLAMFDKLTWLHGKRWQERGEPGLLADAHVQQFHRAALPKLSRAGLLRMWELRIGGETAGVYYGFHHRARVYYYLMGFDPTYEFESPGALLIAHAIERAVREGAREFHFLRGQEAYKYRWGAQDRWNRCQTFQRVALHARAS
jgi:CelD/BcsL family acetyltransferase involved in cellulose biosynthesis